MAEMTMPNGAGVASVDEDWPDGEEPTPGFILSGWLGVGEGGVGCTWELWEGDDGGSVGLYIWPRGVTCDPLYLTVNRHQANRLGRSLANVVGKMLQAEGRGNRPVETDLI